MATAPPLPLQNCYWVFPGLVLAGEYPGGPSPAKTKQRIERLVAAGIECFLDLTHPDELPPYSDALPPHVQYWRKPILDHSVPDTAAQVAEILDCMRASVLAQKPLYVHCRAGIGRTGTIVGCLLVERGLSGPDALQELNRLWQQCRRSKSWPVVPETEEQTNYVASWVAGSAASAPARVATGPSTSRRHARAGHRSAGPGQPRGGTEPSRSGGQARRAGAARASSDARAPSGARGASDSRAASDGRASSDARAAPKSYPANKPRVASTPAPEHDPLLQKETLTAARGVRERFLGALVGLAIGDAIAAATQYRRPGTFTPVGDMLGGGPFDVPRGGWTDDTAMALCLAESLLESNGFDARDQVSRYARWQEDGHLSATGQCVGITASTARALAMAKWRRQVFPGSHDPKQLDPEPLSRVAPAVLYFFPSLETAVQQAADAARTTCQAPAVLEACRKLARAIHAALSGAPKSAILNELPPRPTSAPSQNGSAATALAAASWSFESTDNFRDAVLRAASLGGNSDVVAAVCGQLAGAHYGVSAIPTPWRKALIHNELIESYADRLLTQTLLTLAS